MMLPLVLITLMLTHNLSKTLLDMVNVVYYRDLQWLHLPQFQCPLLALSVCCDPA